MWLPFPRLFCPALELKAEQGTEAIRGFIQSHLRLQLILPRDSPGWLGSQTPGPDCPWALGEFPWGLWAISHHDTPDVTDLRPLAGSS